MTFVEAVEKIRGEYGKLGRPDIVSKIDHCLMQGGTPGERFLILATMLRKLKNEDKEAYQIAAYLNEGILEGADNFYKRD